MLLWIKSKKILFFRHLLMSIISWVLVYFVWKVNPTWSPDMRLWKAFGWWSFALLFFAVFIGPASRVFRPFYKIIKWRREAWIWFFIITLVHTYLVLDGWVRWGVWEFFGYQYVAELEIYLRSEPWFWLANLIWAIAVLLALILAATSFDRVIKFIGLKSWNILHSLSYIIFYLASLHVVYFAFIHFTPSPQRVLMWLPTDYPPNPLAYYYLIAIILVFLVQIISFIKSVIKNKKTI